MIMAVMIVSTSAWAQVTVIPIDGWSGGNCEMPCGNPGQGNYDCSNGHGGWTPNVAFMDIIPAGEVVTKVTSTVFVHNCSGASSTVTSSINGNVIGAATTSTQSCSCLASACIGMQAASQVYPNGFPSYNYGGSNTFSLGVTGLVCVSHATLTLESAPAGLNVSVTTAKAVVEPNLFWCNSKGQCRTQAVAARSTTATITVKNANGPVVGANVVLSVERASVGFGGHDHDAVFTTTTSTRPLGTMGLVKDNGNGSYSATYTAPNIAAEDVIVAKVSKGTQSKQAKSGVITAQVSGLVKLNVVKPHSLIGGTAKHHGPPKNTPDNNHFATTTTNVKITNLLTLYNQNYGAGLYVNDMSLPKGGLFDVGVTRWSSPHLSHRRGIDMDIHTMDVKGVLVKNRLLKIKNKFDGKLFKSILDEGNHLHIYF